MKRCINYFIGIALLIIVCSCNYGRFDVTDLKCDNLVAPIAIDNTTPQFSWINSSSERDQIQTAYQIEVASTISKLKSGNADVWQSGRVESSESVMVPYCGPQLDERRQYVWRVRTWNREGEPSAWSKIARFGVGVLNMERITASYIMSGEQQDFTPVLHKRIHIDEVGEYAIMYVNSLGYHELYINGKKVSEQVLAPAVSQLDRRSQIVSYDVKPYLREGANDLILWLGKGWYKEVTYKAQHNGPVVRAELDMCVNDNWSTIAQTDSSWKYSVSQVGAYTDLGEWKYAKFCGERIDYALLLKLFDADVIDSTEWASVKVVEVDGITPQQQIFPGNRIVSKLDPVEIKEIGVDSLMIDFGRNITGWLRMELSGVESGREVRIDYSDDIDENGVPKKQIEYDIYISAGGNNEIFCNKFNFHGFRYIIITGLKSASSIVKAEALQISSDECVASTFKSSDNDINAIHDMVKYTLSCLAFSGYMVDCPHYERQGYGGDGNASAMTLQTMRNAVSTYYNWTQAWHDVQDADGSMPHVAPTCRRDGGGPYWCGFIIQTPWLAYLNYGDDRMLRRHYSSMKLWLEYVAKYSPDGLLDKWPDIYNRFWYLGDWLAPEGINVTDDRSIKFVSNCFVSECLANISKISEYLGEKDDAIMYDSWRKRLLNQLHESYYNGDYTYASGSPIDLAYALNAGVVKEQLYDAVSSKLVEISREKYNSHIAVGLVGVTIFAEWAIRNGEVELMYDILKQPDYPGYLYMINNGATTTWENWNRDRSRIHNCYNGIGYWFYHALAGIRPDENAPGYRHFFVEPQIPADMEWVNATKNTPYGDITVSWKKEKSRVELKLTVPVGTTATVRLGDIEQRLGSGKHILRGNL